MAENVLEKEDGPSGDEAQSTATTLVRAPQQERSRRTLKRILDAGLYLLEHEGPDALTITGITKRARTSVGSFYARFQGKDDLLRYLGERSLAEALEVWAQLSAGLKAGGELRASVTEVVQRLGWLYLEAAGRSLVLLDGIEDPAPTRRRRLEDSIAADLRELGVVSELRSDLATRVLARILQDSVLCALRDSSSDQEASPYPEAPVLLSELVELLVGYLGGTVRPPTTPTVQEPQSPPPEPEPEPKPAPQLEVREPAESPKREIETEALIEAALAPELPTPPVPEPTREPAPAEEPEPPAEPEPVAEPELEPPPEPESEPEVPSSEEVDPFDVWG